MKGSVRKRYNNAWSYRIDLGFVDGKRKQVEKGGFKTEREATKAMQDVLYHLNNTGDYVENKKISFHTVYEEFIEREGKATRAYATLKKYDSLYLAIPGGLILLCLAGFAAAKIKNRKKGQNEDETIYDADYKVVKSSKDAGTDAGGSDSDEHYPGVSS